ncbi:hypothetical protein BY996DRAFT_6413953 [Phakopsora pachyrhizi]|nr:hypothetical protein BY996DRAFT_6413953 [Phakopsora pachyrhizi]
MLVKRLRSQNTARKVPDQQEQIKLDKRRQYTKDVQKQACPVETIGQTMLYVSQNQSHFECPIVQELTEPIVVDVAMLKHVVSQDKVILAVQQLFAMMTHTKHSYIDVNELSLLLGNEEGETISWTLNEPNCNKTYGIIAEAWQEFAWETHKATSDPHIDDVVQLEKYKAECWLFFWKEHQLTLLLPQDKEIPSQSQSNTDNSTASLTLCAMRSNLNNKYSCIDAQVWVPESNYAHFLDGTSQVFGFEIDPWGGNSPFSLGTEFWIDQYLIQKRHKLSSYVKRSVGLRERPMFHWLEVIN